MGLLSDPSIGTRSRLLQSLDKHARKICAVFYVAGLVWFVCLAHAEFNHGTYLSENALSPGLVYPEMKMDGGRLAQSLVEELERERIHHPSSLPVSWLVAKMKQIGLETHVHNFTLRYPFTNGKEYHGRNVYGILRAPRIGSTEGVVYAAPYRAADSLHTNIVASVPTLLAFADFARKKNYWAKDLVFLVTEQEHLGMQAWLEAYYKGGMHDEAEPLLCGNLQARAGALQAAINLEVQDLDFEYVNVKIEGLNGQLPNLDMFNLVQRIMSREGIASGYQATQRKHRKRQRSSASNLEANLKHMTSMLLSQASGVPTGNHGLFHRYRIEAVTLEAVKRPNPHNGNRPSSALALLKAVEGISRSLNNLLERFHQSFFFYILVQNDRFVSIGDFMPCLMLLVAPLFLKAFLLWIRSFSYEPENDSAVKQKGQHATPALLVLAAAVGLGLACYMLPMTAFVRAQCAAWGLGASTSVNGLVAVAWPLSLFVPFMVGVPPLGGSVEVLHTAALLLLGVTLTLTGLLNFALGFLVAIVSVPLAILIDSESSRDSAKRRLMQLYALFLHPLVIVYGLVLLLTLSQFPELTFRELLLRAFTATTDAITFALMDCIIYGNWLYTLASAVLLPIWTLHWTLTHTYQQGTIKLKED